MRLFKNISRLFAAIAAVTVTATQFARADEPIVESDDDGITVEAQPLASALQEFSAQSGLQVAYVATLAEEVSSKGTHEAETADAALSEILDSTGLEYRFINDETVAIGPAASSEDEAEDPGNSRSAASPMLMAQDRTSAPRNQTNDEGSEEEKRRKMEEILVTGSRIRGAQLASPVVTITREEIDRAGFATVAELVDKLPQNFGAGASLDISTDFANTGNVVGGRVEADAGGVSVNLRGLGTSSTLVLLNGRRLSPSGLSARFTNISSIPMTAIERVEVMTDGASAIYGSDAIGGVVNFILRDDYEGAESRLRYGSDGRGDISHILLGQSFGESWEDGRILLTYEYYDSENLANRDRDITSTSDLTRFGGTDWRVPGGNPANIVAGGQTFAIPSGQDGTALTAADFDPNAPLNLHNPREFGDVIPAVERHSAFLHIKYGMGPLELFAETRFASQKTTKRSSGALSSFEIPDTNPFFVDPTGTGLDTVTVANYSLAHDFGPGVSIGEIDTFGAAFGGRFNIGESWHGELIGNWSKEEATRRRPLGDIDSDAINVALSQSDPDLAFNPFGDGSNTSPAVVESFLDRSQSFGSDSENEVRSLTLNVDGDAFSIPGGDVQVVAGLEFRKDTLLSRYDRTGTGAVTSVFNRDVTSVYAELFFPLVGIANGRRGLQRLELSLAGRYEDYSDFGSSTNPKVGLVWSPTQALSFRGTWGTSFRAPALFDLDSSTSAAAYFPQLFVDLGVIPFPVILRAGGNQDLQAEEASTSTVGIEWRPERVQGLSLDVTYFKVDFQDRIDTPGANIVTGSTDPRFAPFAIFNPTLEQVAALVNTPGWQHALFGVPDADLLSGAAPVGAIIDNRKTNLAQLVVTGMELQASYDFETALGSFDFGFNGQYLFDFERRLLGADPLVDEVDVLGRPIDFRARSNVTWTRHGWSAAAFVNYMDGYTDNVSDPARPVDSWATVDLTLSYDTADASINEWLFSDTRLSLTIQNLFDEDPPFVDTTGGLAYDSVNGDPLGRFLAFQVTKEW